MFSSARFAECFDVFPSIPYAYNGGKIHFLCRNFDSCWRIGILITLLETCVKRDNNKRCSSVSPTNLRAYYVFRIDEQIDSEIRTQMYRMKAVLINECRNLIGFFRFVWHLFHSRTDEGYLQENVSRPVTVFVVFFLVCSAPMYAMCRYLRVYVSTPSLRRMKNYTEGIRLTLREQLMAVMAYSS